MTKRYDKPFVRAEAWPAIVVDDLGDLDPNVFSLIGDVHLKAGKWPLYLFAGDGSRRRQRPRLRRCLVCCDA
jgi:hypothetical protein